MCYNDFISKNGIIGYCGGRRVYKRWKFSKVDKAAASFLAEECGVEPLAALIASSRGYNEPYEIEEFFSDEPQIGDPFEMNGMAAAAKKINEHIEKGSKIAVYGDYDCDGVTASALMYRYLCSRGADVCVVIPDRAEDGYGMSVSKIDELNNAGVSLIITVDNGISAVDEIAHANSLGIETVVTDHHLPGENLPPAFALVDPYLCGDGVFKGLAGVGVAFKTVCAVSGATPEEMLAEYAELVAIGTVADVMPLVYENRSFVKAGLEIMNESPSLGVAALIEESGLGTSEITSESIAFGLSPRINAAGRMGSALRAFDLLLSEDPEEAKSLAAEINGENQRRRQIEADILKEACGAIEKDKMQYDRVIVIGGSGWHFGVIGIVAAKLTEKYGKPTVVLGLEGDVAHGSGRSIEGFSLYEALKYSAETLEKYGGHEKAAGLTVKRENISIFRQKINEYAKKTAEPFDVINIDCKLKPSAVSTALCDALSGLMPYGTANPKPVFAFCGLKITAVASIGSGNHIRISFEKDSRPFSAVMFGKSKTLFEFLPGDTVDIAAVLDKNIYNGAESVSVKIKDIRLSGFNEEDFEKQLSLFETYKRYEFSGEQAAEILPSRHEIGTVYRAASSLRHATLLQIYNRVCGVSLAKTAVAADALAELGFLKKTGAPSPEMFGFVSGAERNDMSNSETLKKIEIKAGEQQ